MGISKLLAAQRVFTASHPGYHKDYRVAHREMYKVASFKHRLPKLMFLRWLRSQPCWDCGCEYHFSAVDFDHRGNKVFTLSRCISYSWARLVEEVLKCDVVCANCHRKRTWMKNANKIIFDGNTPA